jgi:hypothetical protein
MLHFDLHRRATLATWLRGECKTPPATLVGAFTKQGANIKAGHKWGSLQLDDELALWVGKDFIDQTIALRPSIIRGLRGVQLLHVPPLTGSPADATGRMVREFVMSHGRLRRMDEIVADPQTRTASHPYFPCQPIFIAKYKGLSVAHPFVLTYDASSAIVAARTMPRGHATPVHPIIPAPGAAPLAYVFGGALQHLAVNHLSGIALHVPVARAGNLYRITAGETPEGRPRFHHIGRPADSKGVAVELEEGIPIAIYTDPAPTDTSTRQALLVKRRWPDRSPQECMPSNITARWLSRLPILFTGQVVKPEGVVWVQNRPLYVGHRFASLSAETMAISEVQANHLGTQATFQVNIMDEAGDVVRSCGFTWQGQGVAAWSAEALACIAQMQPVAQRRVLEQASWLPLSTEMLARGWLLRDVGDLVRRVTDLGLGQEKRVVRYIETAIRAPRGRGETEAEQVRRLKQELLEWLDVFDGGRGVSTGATSRHPSPTIHARPV